MQSWKCSMLTPARDTLSRSQGKRCPWLEWTYQNAAAAALSILSHQQTLAKQNSTAPTSCQQHSLLAFSDRQKFEC